MSGIRLSFQETIRKEERKTISKNDPLMLGIGKIYGIQMAAIVITN